jgi:hypothetical protein
MKLTTLLLFTLTISLQANDWTGWSDEKFFPTEKRISYRSRCNNSPNDGKHEWQVKFKNLTSAKLTFSFGIGVDTSVKLNKQMDLGAGKEDWNWELLALTCTSQAWVSVRVVGATTDKNNNIINKDNNAKPKPTKEWSSLEPSRMNFMNAKRACESKGMRLGTSSELQDAYEAKMYKLRNSIQTDDHWDQGAYWSDQSNVTVDFYSGSVYEEATSDYEGLVRCHRK